MNKHDLKNLVAKDDIQKALDAILEITSSNDNHLHNEAIHLSSRFTGYLKDLNSNRDDKKSLEIRLNNIRDSLNFLIDRLPDEKFSVSSAFSQKPQPLADNTITSQPNPKKQQPPTSQIKKPASHIPWIMGLGLLLLVTAIAFFIPFPTGWQKDVFLTVLALAAAGVAAIIPGYIEVEQKGFLRAGGAIAVFCIVYFFKPTPSVPFNFTVRLQAENLPAYPQIKGGNLKIWVVDDYKKPELNSDNVAVVKGIPASEEGRQVDAYLENASYWKLEVDSVTLSKTSQTLQVVPDGSLAEISGKVKSEKEGIALEDIIVEAEGVKDTTDTNGSFRLLIPVKRQKSEYNLSATPLKKGFVPMTKAVYAGKNLEIRLKK